MIDDLVKRVTTLEESNAKLISENEKLKGKALQNGEKDKRENVQSKAQGPENVQSNAQDPENDVEIVLL